MTKDSIKESSELPDSKVATVVLNQNNYTLAFADSQDHILRTIRETGKFYESNLLMALTPFLSSSDLVLDVGANVGNHAVYFAGEADCTVLAFEPVEEAFECLLENIDASGLHFKIHPRNFALGATNSHAGIGAIDHKNLGATRLEPNKLGGSIVVRAVDSLPEVQSDIVRLIKVDVEGMELGVLQGALGTIERDKPVLVVECQTDIDLAGVEDLLSPVGYRAVECFNATPTYIFLHREWTGSSTHTLSDYLLEVALRSSRANQQLVFEVNRLRRVISSEHSSYLSLQERVDSIASSSSGAE